MVMLYLIGKLLKSQTTKNEVERTSRSFKTKEVENISATEQSNTNMAWKSKIKFIKILKTILPGRVYVTTRESPEHFSSSVNFFN